MLFLCFWSGDRVEREHIDELLRDIRVMRQRHTADLNLLRQVIDDKAQVARDVLALREQRDHWMREKLELEDRLHHLQALLNSETGNWHSPVTIDEYA